MVGVGRALCGSSSPTPCQSRVTYSRLHRTLSRRVLNISRDRDSTTSLGSLFQGSINLRGKKFFLMFRRDFLCFSSSRGLFFPDRRGLGLSCSRGYKHPSLLTGGKDTPSLVQPWMPHSSSGRCRKGLSWKHASSCSPLPCARASYFARTHAPKLNCGPTLRN